jgi:glucosamine--fructose-6-phosphate aminotransferase (isomerizing)
MQGRDSYREGGHTLAEILTQPEVWLAALRDLRNSKAFQEQAKESGGRSDWLFVGCGTSYYLAEAAAAARTALTGGRARALPASEILLFPHLVQLDADRTQAVVISRSGKTSEALRAAEALSRKVPTLGITCTANSELEQNCRRTMVLAAADEKSLVMTRSFTTMYLALLQLAAETAGNTTMPAVIGQAAASLGERIERFSREIEGFVAGRAFEDFVYLAQGPLFPAAREAALKVTEMSCSYAQSFHTLEFRHGPKAIVSPKTLLMFLVSESGMSAECEVLAEMKELGGTVIAICDRATDAVQSAADLVLEIGAGIPEIVFPAPFIVPGQLLGLHYGLKKGFNPDEPKNLNRVVILD